MNERKGLLTPCYTRTKIEHLSFVTNARGCVWRLTRYLHPLIDIGQVKSAGTTIKDKLETASLEAGLARPGEETRVFPPASKVMLHMLFADLERPEVSHCSAAVLLCSGLCTIDGETATKQRSVSHHPTEFLV